ncbi:hypothetical protein HYO05_23565 [Vibrio parahaemolyticus]|uniref:hypothetical protein n=1 Tax=Vibrio parahaemolyticus TaxID=670 RepID=UPI0008D9C13A|nr:hypothetical protein [Vibrio parahaemolyticus]EGQ8047723.1 hypothetical protein [Vibrio parahaemolyticus]EHH2867894.1 hypothetical protein [Vibrio parahaemolyticus]ELA9316578.1 hypothetical protein [Vibrio parahaemolyticus]MBM5037000.1 hypothetical protein [Vibrio parahaemolyticus]MBM5050737.1 hypothetical protein [Vibrio parahaemolyticus]
MNISGEARAFRKALESIAREDKSVLDALDGAEPLHNFPSGSCGLASNLFAYHLCQKGFEASEVSVVIEKGTFHSIKTHAWVLANDKYIDLTADQFPEITRQSVVIHDTDSINWLVTLKELAESQDNGHVYVNVPELHTGWVDYSELYKQVVERIART